MDMRRIREIVRIIDGSSVVEFSYKDEDIEIVLKKKEAFTPGEDVREIQSSVQQVHTQPPTLKEQPEEGRDPNLVEIKSPMVGTFYRAPSPTSPPYVEVGDEVKKGDVLCIIEAMKIMNEIEAEFSCRIEKILVENAERVEFDQPLFLVKKLG